MTSNIESLKADYLAEYQKTFPRLKSLIMAIRSEETKLTEDAEINAFWQITNDPKTNYELCQLAMDIDGLDDFFLSSNNEKSKIVETFDNEKESLNLEKLKESCWELWQQIWRIESMSKLAITALTAEDDSQFNSDLKGTLDTIAIIANQSHEILELEIEKPIKTFINSEIN